MEEFRSEEIPPWIVLPAPLLNPNGPFYSNAELAELYRKCQELGMRVIVDISFSGLEFKEDEENDVDLGSILSQGNVVILGEVAHQVREIFLDHGLEFLHHLKNVISTDFFLSPGAVFLWWTGLCICCHH